MFDEWCSAPVSKRGGDPRRLQREGEGNMSTFTLVLCLVSIFVSGFIAGEMWGDR